MPTSYSSNLRLALPASGELVGTWGTEVNDAISELLEDAITKYQLVAHNDSSDYVLTTNDGTPDEARSAVLRVTGALTAARNVVCPAVPKVYLFVNATTGGFPVTLKTPSGTGFAVPMGSSAMVYCDGTNVEGGLTGVPEFPEVGGNPLTAAEILAALAAASKVDYLVSCSDLTTALVAGANAGFFRITQACTAYEVRAGLLVASSSGVVELDIKKNGTTILSTPLTVDSGETTSVTAATPAVISVPSLADDDRITVDIVQAGTGAKGLVIAVMGRAV